MCSLLYVLCYRMCPLVSDGICYTWKLWAKILKGQRSSPCMLQKHYGECVSRTLSYARYKGGMEGTFPEKKNILHLLPRLTKILASDRSSPCTRQRHYGWYFSRTLVHARYKGGMEDTFFFSQKLCLAISLLFLRYRFQALLLFLHTYVYCTYECGAYEYAYGCPAYVCILYIWVWCV